MIKKQKEFAVRSEPPVTIKPPSSSVQSKFSVPKSNSQGSVVFDATRILHRYREARDNQHEKLAGINLSEQLKKQLFGFSQQHYLTNNIRINDILIQNHPLKGRIIMSKQKYQIYMYEKQQEKQIKSSEKGDFSNYKKKLNLFDMISVNSFNEKKIVQLSQDSLMVHHRSQET